jgi:hypothetical protein
MDYKYIEQLLERYWAAETTLDEERILRSFFSDAGHIPAHLQPYAKLFAGLQAAKMSVVKARPITWRTRLRPLLQAAALIALMMSTGLVTQRSMQQAEDSVGRAMAKQGNDSTVEVQVAYEPVQRVDSAVIIDETLLK